MKILKPAEIICRESAIQTEYNVQTRKLECKFVRACKPPFFLACMASDKRNYPSRFRSDKRIYRKFNGNL